MFEPATVLVVLVAAIFGIFGFGQAAIATQGWGAVYPGQGSQHPGLVVPMPTLGTKRFSLPDEEFSNFLKPLEF